MEVFISYKREDRAQVDAIADDLRALGLQVWYDEGLTPGEAYSSEIDRAITASRVVLVCWSRAAANSDFVIAEAQKAWSLKKLAAANLDPQFDGSRLQVPLNTVHAPSVHGRKAIEHENWPRIVSRIANLCERPQLYSLWQFKSDVAAGRYLPRAAIGLENWIAQHPNDPAVPIAKSLLQEIAPHRERLRADEQRRSQQEARLRERQFAAEQKRLRQQLDSERRRREQIDQAKREAARGSFEKLVRQTLSFALIGGSLVTIAAAALGAYKYQDVLSQTLLLDSSVPVLAAQDRLSRPDRRLLSSGRAFMDSGRAILNADGVWSTANRAHLVSRDRGSHFFPPNVGTETIVVSAGRSLRLINLRTGESTHLDDDVAVRSCPEELDTFYSCNFVTSSPDGSRALIVPTGSFEDSGAILIDGNTGRSIVVFPPQNRRLSLGWFAPNSRTFERAGSFFSTSDGRHLRTLPDRLVFQGFDLSRDDVAIVAAISEAGARRQYFEFDLHTGESRPLADIENCIDTTCRVLVTRRGLLRVHEHSARFEIIEVRSNRTLFAAIGESATRRFRHGGSGDRACYSINQDGSYLLAPHDGGAVVYDLNSNGEMRFLLRAAGDPFCPQNAFSDDGRRVYLDDRVDRKVFVLPNESDE